MKKSKLFIYSFIFCITLFSLMLDYTDALSQKSLGCWGCILRGDIYQCESGLASGTSTACSQSGVTCTEGTGQCGN